MNDYENIPKLIENAVKMKDLSGTDSMANIYINNYLFEKSEKEFYTVENLDFIARYLCDEKSKSFKLFMNQSEKINALLGDQKAQYEIMNFITKKYFTKQFIERDSASWCNLEKQLSAKFGPLGLETVLGQKMVYYLSKSKWEDFSETYIAYFARALKHPMYDINNITWPIFQHATDYQTLQFACSIMEYAIENWDRSHEALDTYANILYKIGKKTKAIEWEERAVKLSGSNKELVETLGKMRKGEKTWED